MDSLYSSTRCEPLNVYLVWGSLAILTALVTIVKMNMNADKTLVIGNKQVKYSLTQLVVALIVSIVAVVLLAHVFKALCNTAIGTHIAFVVVGLLLVGTAWMTAEVYTNVVTRRELAAVEWVREKVPGMGARPLALSSTSSM